jgi:hypothetical protein
MPSRNRLDMRRFRPRHVAKSLETRDLFAHYESHVTSSRRARSTVRFPAMRTTMSPFVSTAIAPIA